MFPTWPSIKPPTLLHYSLITSFIRHCRSQMLSPLLILLFSCFSTFSFLSSFGLSCLPPFFPSCSHYFLSFLFFPPLLLSSTSFVIMKMDTCWWLLFTALFRIRKGCRQLKYLSRESMLNKLWCFQMMEHYACLENNQKALYVLIWKYLPCILLSEKRNMQKNLYFMFPFVKKTWWWGISFCFCFFVVSSKHMKKFV